MASELQGLRAQTLANAKILLSSTTPTAPTTASQATLIPPTANLNFYHDMDIVVFGPQGKYIAAIMVGLKPAIEGDQALNPEGAIRKLFLATCELLTVYIPKVGAHQRNIHGGGVFDEDMISADLIEALRKSP